MPVRCPDCGCLSEGGVRISVCDRPSCCCAALPAGEALERMAAALRAAFDSRDLTSFGALLADGARWGEDDAPNRCRSRAEVVATFQRLIDDGVEGQVADMQTGPAGILCHLRIHWPGRAGRSGPEEVFHLYRVRDGRIAEIRPYADREAAERDLSVI